MFGLTIHAVRVTFAGAWAGEQGLFPAVFEFGCPSACCPPRIFKRANRWDGLAVSAGTLPAPLSPAYRPPL